jgi:hypothetical protein
MNLKMPNVFIPCKFTQIPYASRQHRLHRTEQLISLIGIEKQELFCIRNLFGKQMNWSRP